jgi:hypothetical protein
VGRYARCISDVGDLGFQKAISLEDRAGSGEKCLFGSQAARRQFGCHHSSCFTLASAAR